MASTSAKVLLASVACCGPLLLAGLRIAAGPRHDSTAAPIERVTLASAADGAAASPPSQPRLQSQPAATAPANPIRVAGWPFQQLARPLDGARSPTDEEWQQAVALFSDISPVRWRVFEQVLTKPARRDRARRYLFARYLELREVQKTNPNLYAAKLQRVNFEADFFRLDPPTRAPATPADAQKLRDELHDKVMERVNKDLGDREQRLRQLQEQLDREKAVLEQDRKRSDLMVENRSTNLRRLSTNYRNWAAGRNANANTPGGRGQNNANNRNRAAQPPPNPDKPVESDD